MSVIPAQLSRRFFLHGGIAALGLICAGTARAGGGMALDAQGRAIGGFDALGYWDAAVARNGQDLHQVMWRGAVWRFSSAEDAARFEAEPERFEVQFGGFCTRALSFKKQVHADPEVWRIFEDKLYMFAKPVGGRKFDEGPHAMIAKAQAYWDTL